MSQDDTIADREVTRTRVVVIGAGFGGIGLGIKLMNQNPAVQIMRSRV